MTVMGHLTKDVATVDASGSAGLCHCAVYRLATSGCPVFEGDRVSASGISAILPTENDLVMVMSKR